jgi:hypothetical protein
MAVPMPRRAPLVACGGGSEPIALTEFVRPQVCLIEALSEHMLGEARLFLVDFSSRNAKISLVFNS